MKLWLAELMLSVSKEYGISPTSCYGRSGEEVVVEWRDGPDKLMAAYYSEFKLLRRWNRDYKDHGYVQYLFYSDGKVGQVTSVSSGWVSEEWFDLAGNSTTYEHFISIYF
jgi:hypothetical protein